MDRFLTVLHTKATTAETFAFAIREGLSVANRGTTAISHTKPFEPLARHLSSPCLC